MGHTWIHYQWNPAWRESGSRTGVSLHSHTSCSREPLDFIPRCAATCGWLVSLLRRYEQRYRKKHGCDLDYRGAWWTPPLGPREALQLESAQIERLGMQGLVSLTDHDSIEAPLGLRLLPEGRSVPISVEWSVPWTGTVFHLGVHNLPPAEAKAAFEQMQDWTADPRAARLEELLAWLSGMRQLLLVFNHPYWDEKGKGAEYHAAMAERFLVRYRRWIHALELNGLRPWRENRRTLALAEQYGMVCVSGGDRHGCEPNVLLNLTDASDFDSFAEEVRERRASRVLVLKQYREPQALRILSAICDVMRSHEQHSYGWARWSDRVFIRDASGDVRALAEIFPEGREPSLVRTFVLLARLADTRGARLAMRQLFREAGEPA
ncbi:MAG: PHP domain-containing protein [Bryobacteraceae bacterium]